MPAITETAQINANSDTLWKEIGGFGAVGEWHPMLERVDIAADGADGVGTTRTAHTVDGSEQVERLSQIDPTEHTYQYTMERSALPVRDYVGRFRIEPVGSEGSRVIWSARFEVADSGDGRTIETIRKFLRAGTESLEMKYGGIPGYDYASASTAHSPLTLNDLHALEQTVGWGEEDAAALKMAATVLSDQAEAMVDSWRVQIAAQPHLAQWFFGPDGKPDDAYKAAVKKRFVQWVVDTCTRPRDQAWLDYQEEIGLRHTPAKKNATEGAHTADRVPLRYLIAFTAPVVLGARHFLAAKGHSAEEVERMQAAWTKSVLLQIALWSRPYLSNGLW